MIITTNDYKNQSQAPLSARVANEPRPQPRPSAEPRP